MPENSQRSAADVAVPVWARPFFESALHIREGKIGAFDTSQVVLRDGTRLVRPAMGWEHGLAKSLWGGARSGVLILKRMRPVLFIGLLTVLLCGSFLPGGMAVSFLPPGKFSSCLPGKRHAPPVDKFVALLSQLTHLIGLDPRVFSHHTNDALVAVLDFNEDKSLCLERADVGADLALADVEELGEISVRRVAAIGVVERMDFDEQNFFHQRQMPGKPDLPWNPHPFEVA
jgi:hypothetical protein